MLGAAEAYASPTSEIRKATAADEPVFHSAFSFSRVSTPALSRAVDVAPSQRIDG